MGMTGRVLSQESYVKIRVDRVAVGFVVSVSATASNVMRRLFVI